MSFIKQLKKKSQHLKNIIDEIYSTVGNIFYEYYNINFKSLSLTSKYNVLINDNEFNL